MSIYSIIIHTSAVIVGGVVFHTHDDRSLGADVNVKIARHETRMSSLYRRGDTRYDVICVHFNVAVVIKFSHSHGSQGWG